MTPVPRVLGIREFVDGETKLQNNSLMKDAYFEKERAAGEGRKTLEISLNYEIVNIHLIHQISLISYSTRIGGIKTYALKLAYKKCVHREFTEYKSEKDIYIFTYKNVYNL